MTTPQASAPPLEVPRFARNLNRLAEEKGLAVKVRTAARDYGDLERRLWALWKGPTDTFYALGLLQPSQRLPLKEGVLSIPSHVGPFPEYALLTGYLMVEDGTATWELDFGPADYELEQRGQIEVITYADETLYHGAPAALVAAGIDKRRVTLGKRPSSASARFNYPHPAWRSRRQPDGTIVHRVESPSASARRLAKERLEQQYAAEYRQSLSTSLDRPPTPAATAQRPYLRLVIDNTKESNHA